MFYFFHFFSLPSKTFIALLAVYCCSHTIPSTKYTIGRWNETNIIRTLTGSEDDDTEKRWENFLICYNEKDDAHIISVNRTKTSIEKASLKQEAFQLIAEQMLFSRIVRPHCIVHTHTQCGKKDVAKVNQRRMCRTILDIAQEKNCKCDISLFQTKRMFSIFLTAVILISFQIVSHWKWNNWHTHI